MANRPTIQDIAAEAGVSVATVDRVLNGRLKVREETARKVSEAAQRIGYHAVNLIEKRLRADLPELRMGFVLLHHNIAFYQSFTDEVHARAEDLPRTRGSVQIKYMDGQSPDEAAELMLSLAPRVDAIAAVAVNHNKVTEAVIQLKEAGIPTFALLNDFAQGERQAYIGLNNLKAGRIAAWMVGTASAKAGRIATFVGGQRWHGHDLRETGFRSYIREAKPDFQVLDTFANQETQTLTYETTRALLAKHTDLVGLYLAGGGMEGAIQALKESRAPGEIALVVHELTTATRSALSDGYVTTVIATPLRTLVTEVMAQMRAEVLGPRQTAPGQTFLDPLIYLPESV